MIIKNMKKIIAVFSLLLCSQVNAALITSVQSPYQTSVQYPFTLVGSVFSVDIIGTDFISNVDGGGVNLSFDQSMLNVLSVSIDESIWNFGSTGISTGTIDNAAGTVDGIMVNTFADVAGDFVIATIEFEAIGLGSSFLSLTELGINPWASAGSLINPTYESLQVDVSAIPVPAAVWLFGSGLIGLLGIARRK